MEPCLSGTSGDKLDWKFIREFHVGHLKRHMSNSLSGVDTKVPRWPGCIPSSTRTRMVRLEAKSTRPSRSIRRIIPIGRTGPGRSSGLIPRKTNKIERVRKILDHKKVEYISPYFTDEKENLT